MKITGGTVEVRRDAALNAVVREAEFLAASHPNLLCLDDAEKLERAAKLIREALSSKADGALP